MSEVVVDAIVEKGVLQQFVDTYRPIVDECKIHCNEDGLAARAVDPANVAMTLADVDTAAFEAYESGAVTIGVNLETLDERLSVADAGDLVSLAVDMESRMLELEAGFADQHIGLIDPDTMRADPDHPDLDLPNTVTIEGADVAEAVDVIDMVSDHLEIVGDPDAKEVRFVGAGDVDESTVTFDRERTLDPTDVVQPTEALFSTDYLTDLVDPIPSDAEVTLTFGDEFPVKIEWTASEGHQSATQTLAPRIQSD